MVTPQAVGLEVSQTLPSSSHGNSTTTSIPNKQATETCNEAEQHFATPVRVHGRIGWQPDSAQLSLEFEMIDDVWSSGLIWLMPTHLTTTHRCPQDAEAEAFPVSDMPPITSEATAHRLEPLLIGSSLHHLRREGIAYVPNKEDKGASTLQVLSLFELPF